MIKISNNKYSFLLARMSYIAIEGLNFELENKLINCNMLSAENWLVSD